MSPGRPSAGGTGWSSPGHIQLGCEVAGDHRPRVTGDAIVQLQVPDALLSSPGSDPGPDSIAWPSDIQLTVDGRGDGAHRIQELGIGGVSPGLSSDGASSQVY